MAGPNGSGKSSIYGSSSDAIYGDSNITDFSRSFWIINPDLLTSRIRSAEGKRLREANLEAVRRIEAWLETSINAHQSVGVETVLSTSKYRRLVRAAKRRGFEIRLIYVILETPDLNVERVRLRVRKGGHDVPVEKVRERWARSLRQLPWFLNQADWALIFDNSRKLRIVGRKMRGTVTLDPSAPSAIQEVAKKIRRLNKR
ncbi:MAG: zeta toxin family protein [Xanthobacteraceae bacterium]